MTRGWHVALLLGAACMPAAHAYVGEGYLQLPGVSGGWQGASHKDWIRTESRHWGTDGYAPPNGTGARRARGFFSGPAAPTTAGELVVSVDKHSPALAALLQQCGRQAGFPEVVFAESANDFRNAALQLGDRPAAIPEFFEYRLRDVQFKDCPVAATAPEQALVLKFGSIELLNYQGKSEGVEVSLAPAVLPSAQATGKVRSFIVSWFGFAHDISNDQCPQMNRKPLPEEFGMTPEQIARDTTGGFRNPLERRGPGKLSACLLPGVSPDPGNAAPKTTLARGLDLDDDDGAGPAPARSCKHANFESEDGRSGIENQFYVVASCIAGLQGKKGLWQQVLNEEWRSGAVSLLLQISGIDDEKNDDSVDVTLLYSQDVAAKDATGKEILPDYTFRVADRPEFTHYFARLHARIVNGVIITEPAQRLDFNLVKGPVLRMTDARMRLEITPDGNLKGLLGGYEDWRYLANYYNSTGFEVTFGFQCPGFYNALKRSADGRKDPVTGDCNGISAAYDIEAVPAFVPPSQGRALLAQPAPRAGREP